MFCIGNVPLHDESLVRTMSPRRWNDFRLQTLLWLRMLSELYIDADRVHSGMRISKAFYHSMILTLEVRSSGMLPNYSKSLSNLCSIHGPFKMTSPHLPISIQYRHSTPFPASSISPSPLFLGPVLSSHAIRSISPCLQLIINVVSEESSQAWGLENRATKRTILDTISVTLSVVNSPSSPADNPSI